MASSTSHGALAYFAVHALQEWWRLREGEKRPKRCKEKEHMHTPTIVRERRFDGRACVPFDRNCRHHLPSLRFPLFLLQKYYNKKRQKYKKKWY